MPHLTEKLKELQCSLDAGLITKQEYDTMRSQIINQFSGSSVVSNQPSVPLQANAVVVLEDMPVKNVAGSINPQYVQAASHDNDQHERVFGGLDHNPSAPVESNYGGITIRAEDIFDVDKFPNGGPRPDQSVCCITIFCLPCFAICPLSCLSTWGCYQMVDCLTSMPCKYIPCSPCDPNAMNPLWYDTSLSKYIML